MQVARQHNGAARVSRGPYRLNPRYAVDVDPVALRRYVLLGRHRSPRLETPEAVASATDVCRVVSRHVERGEEECAADLLVVALSSPALRLELDERIALLSKLAAMEIQLGQFEAASGHAVMLERLGGQHVLPVAQMEGLHIQAIAARQRYDFDRAIALDKRAMACLVALKFPASCAWYRWALPRDLAISYSLLVQSRERGRLVERGKADALWSRATRLFRESLRLAEQAGVNSEVTHCVMRLACHRLAQHRRTPIEEREVTAGADRVKEFTVPMSFIWRRVNAAEKLLRSSRAQRDSAVEAFARCARESLEHGYMHQFRLVESTFRAASMELRDVVRGMATDGEG
ncbi:uncharacterized protein CMC5_054270 [Chondromyces crocatus]|uniref:Uncharacterized protein n=1 Tax=Chondromyces crocatus TaxID=52 RepID=A0A0K1EK68_CHOCO|nr:uncharacterized protein CMC5_054270 [Chondromyces crocatus]